MGITKRIMEWADYEKMLEKQGNKCCLCGIEFNNKKITHVDHDHETGLVRGILCIGCNIAVGFFENSDLDAIGEYLYQSEKAQEFSKFKKRFGLQND